MFGNGMQAQLDRLCRQLAIPMAKVGADGSLPVEVFAAAAKSCGVKAGTMPETSALIAGQSGLKWTPPGHDHRWGDHGDPRRPRRPQQGRGQGPRQRLTPALGAIR